MEDCQCLGEYLKEQRLGKGLSLKDISYRTKVTLSYLQALEDGHYHRLPAETYLKGFLVSYAESLDLPTQKVLELYRNECPPKADVTLSSPGQPVPNSSIPLFGRPVIIGLVLLFCVVSSVAAWYIATNQRTVPVELPSSSVPVTKPVIQAESFPLPREEEKSLSLQEENISRPEAVVTESPEEEPVIVSQPALADKGIQTGSTAPLISLPAVMELKATQPVSVEITIDGRPVQPYTLQAGSLLRWRVKESVELQTESADAVQVSLGGVEVSPDATGRIVHQSLEN